MIHRRKLFGLLAGTGSLAACQAPPPSAAVTPVTFVPVEGIGYVFLNAPIVAQSRDLLLRNIDGLIGAGARTIRLAINSPGGEITAAQSIVDYLTTTHARRGIQFETFNVGRVSSSATYVFLSAQRRFARPGTGFLFHAAGLVSSGPVSAERLREEASKIDDYERAVRNLLKTRTRLTDGAIDVFLHRTVVLSADDALRDGVVDGLAGFTAPQDAKVITVGVRPGTGTGRSAVPQEQVQPTGGR